MIILILIWNIAVFVLYGVDKLKAVNNSWRISEKCLLISTVIFGGVGAILGMEIFHHKTKHIKFKILVPLSFVITMLLLSYLLTM